MIEVELKYEIDPAYRMQFQAILDAVAQRVRHFDNVDAYYDTASYDCLQHAVFMRIRDHAHLEVKFHEDADPAHMHSTEQVFPLRGGPRCMKEMNVLCSRLVPGWREAKSVEEAMRINGLVEFVVIKKQRTQYIYQDMVLCLDHVEGLGNFFEIETGCEREAGTDQAVARLERFVSGLALPVLRPVRVGYVELWLRQHLPQVYRLGAYQVENYDGQDGDAVDSVCPLVEPLSSLRNR